MNDKNSASFLKNFALPKGWRVEKTTLYCPLAKTGFKVDFSAQKKPSFGQALVKAIGFKNQALFILDTTAGWLKDSFLMTQLGCQVQAIESHPFVFHFSKVSWEAFCSKSSSAGRAKSKEMEKKLNPSELAGSLKLLLGNSVDHLISLKKYEDYPDVVFIDPMFGGRKKSTSKKDLRILKELTGGKNNKEEIFQSALLKAKQRVVVKRHKLEKPLKPKPLFSFKGQSVCYDVFQPIGDKIG